MREGGEGIVRKMAARDGANNDDDDDNDGHEGDDEREGELNI